MLKEPGTVINVRSRSCGCDGSMNLSLKFIKSERYKCFWYCKMMVIMAWSTKWKHSNLQWGNAIKEEKAFRPCVFITYPFSQENVFCQFCTLKIWVMKSYVFYWLFLHSLTLSSKCPSQKQQQLQQMLNSWLQNVILQTTVCGHGHHRHCQSFGSNGMMFGFQFVVVWQWSSRKCVLNCILK